MRKALHIRVVVASVFLGAVLWAAGAESAQFTLLWSDNSSNETGFEIEKRLGTTGAFTPPTTLPLTTTTYVDLSVVGGNVYCYRVRAVNASGPSAYTNEACATAADVTVNITATTATATEAGLVPGRFTVT